MGHFGLAVPPPDSSLLNAGADSTWQNLGDWSHADRYPDAARALAVRLGRTVGLSAADRLIDVGCGCGDQLVLWQTEFGVPEVIGLEPHRPSAERAAVRVGSKSGVSVEVASHRALRNAVAFAPTVIVSLDAAYHFDSRRRFLLDAAAALPRGGRLGLTDLFILGPRPDLRARALAAAAGIPQANLWSPMAWATALGEAGFSGFRFVDRTRSVLGGFGAFGRRRLSEGWRWRNLAGAARLLGSGQLLKWIPIWATALAAADAAHRGWLGYAVITARRC